MSIERMCKCSRCAKHWLEDELETTGIIGPADITDPRDLMPLPELPKGFCPSCGSAAYLIPGAKAVAG